VAPLCPCVNYASESGYYKNIYFKKVFDALHTNHVKWSYKFVALLELDLPYNAQHSKGGTKVVFRKCVFDIYQLQFDLE
jgi:hypothetical protein